MNQDRQLSRSLVVISLDGLNPAFLGPYGNTWFPTPGFDRLAADGMLLEHAFTASVDLLDSLAICWGKSLDSSSANAVQPTLPRRLGSLSVPARLISDVPEVIELGRQFGFETHADRSGLGIELTRSDELEASTPFRLVGSALSVLERRGLFGLTWVHWSGLLGAWDAPADEFVELRDDEDPEAADWLAPPCDLDFRAGSEEENEDLRFQLQIAYAAQIRVWDAAIEFFRDGLKAIAPDETPALVFLAPRGFSVGLHGRCAGFSDLYGDVLQVPVLLLLEPSDAGIRIDRLSCLDELSHTLETWLSGNSSNPETDPWLACRAELTTAGRDRLFWKTETTTSMRTRYWLTRLPAEGKPELFVKPDDRFEVSDIADRLPEVIDALSDCIEAWKENPSPLSSAFNSPLPPPPGAA